MAVCRWSEHSDVYLWPAGDYYECSLCKLDKWYVEEGNVEAHLRDHIAAGHKVPDYALKRAIECDKEDNDYHALLWEPHPDYKDE